MTRDLLFKMFEILHPGYEKHWNSYVRELTILDAEKIVLTSEFLRCFQDLQPVHGRGSTAIGRIAARKQRRFDQALAKEFHRCTLDFFEVPQDRIKEKSLPALDRRKRDTLQALESMPADQRKREEDFYNDLGLGFKTYHALGDMHTASFLDRLLQVWADEQGLFRFYNALDNSDDLLRLHLVCYYHREMSVLVDFWKAVNNLQQYNELFPDAPPPPKAGPRNKDDTKEGEGVWSPVPARI